MQRASEEQANRKSDTDKKFAVLKFDQRVAANTDYLTIISAFILMSSGMFLSYILLQANQTIVGSIFGGSTMLFAAKAFLGFRKT